MADIEKIRKEYEVILQEISNPDLISDWEKFEEVSKKKNTLEKILDKHKELEELKKRIEENKAIISAGEDTELISLAETETSQLQEKEKILQEEINKLLEPETTPQKGAAAAIIEIRAGTGGQEAALFAGDLFRMYSRYAQIQGWQQKILDSHPTDLSGFKEIVFELSPGNKKTDSIFLKMQQEGGVHRVQRIPETEKNGRIHTSTASVAILPKPKKTEIKIKPDELKIDFYRASGPGGQYVNKRETAVRITHLPTNIVVTSQTERNQLQNKENAMAILSAKIQEKKEEENQLKIAGKRKDQIGKAKRAEKIRTYNFPQDRVTDHRIKKSFHNLQGIMEGKIDNIIEILKKNIED